MANLGVPVKLLHESLGHIITVELKTGEVSYVFLSGFICMRRMAKLTSARCTEGSLWRVSYNFSSRLRPNDKGYKSIADLVPTL